MSLAGLGAGTVGFGCDFGGADRPEVPKAPRLRVGRGFVIVMLHMLRNEMEGRKRRSSGTKGALRYAVGARRAVRLRPP